MTAKDFLFLALLAVAALVFYCHGFFSGVSRTRKVYEALLGVDNSAASKTESAGQNDVLDENWSESRPRSRFSGQDLRGDFGDN